MLTNSGYRRKQKTSTKCGIEMGRDVGDGRTLDPLRRNRHTAPMPMVVQCGTCGVKYNVADTLGGKKIRCKKCGGVIPVPVIPSAGARRATSDVSSDGPDLSGVQTDDEEEIPPAPAQPLSNPRAPRRPNVLPPVSRMPDEVIVEGPDDDEDDDDAAVARALAANRPFAFPGSRLLDTFTPWVIGVGSFIWMIAATLLAESPGPAWVPHLRWALYLAAYLLIIYPLTLAGVWIAGAKQRFGMPPYHPLRTLATFSLPFNLGIILALSGETMSSFVTGIIVGLCFAMGIFIFLYRLRPQQMGAGSAIVGGLFLAGVAMIVLIGSGINAMMVAAMTRQQTVADYKKSPLGPTFHWPTPAVVIVKKNPVEAGPTAPPATTQSAATQPAEVSTTQSTPQQATTVPRMPTTGPATIAEKIAAVAATQPLTPAPGKTVAAGMITSDSPWVASVSNEATIGEFVDIYYPSLAGGSIAMVIKSRGPTGDAVELWNMPPFEKRSSFTAAHPPDEHPIYILGPKGQTYAKLTDFPRKGMLEIRSTVDDSIVRRIELNVEKLGAPIVVGFAAANQIIVLWEQGQEFGLQSIDTVTGIPARGFIALAAFQKGKGNLAISPDGKYIAAAVKAAAPIIGRPPAVPVTPAVPPELIPAIQLSDVPFGARKPVILPVTALGAAAAPNFAGIYFSPDATKVTILYAQGGSYLILTWKPSDPKPAPSEPMFDAHPVDAAGYQGPALDALPGATANSTRWLLFGSILVDGNQIVGTLGIPNIRGHRIFDRDTIAVTVPGVEGKQRLVTVKLNAAKTNR